MAEGGMLDWKRQVITQNGPVADYSQLRQPLIPPKGLKWQKDEQTKEWSIVSKTVDSAIPIEDNNQNKNSNNPDKPTSQLKQKDAVKGKDFLEHFIQPTDTFQGICLTYHISGTQLRQANIFSGTNLKLAPNPLIIPLEDSNSAKIDVYHVRKHQYDSQEGKIHQFLAEVCPQFSMNRKEAKL